MYELALHFNPQCAEAYNNLGVIYKDRDNLDRAVECYTVRALASVHFIRFPMRRFFAIYVRQSFVGRQVCRASKKML